MLSDATERRINNRADYLKPVMESAAPARNTQLVLDSLCKTYARSSVPAVDRISFVAEPGQLVCLVGSSGCGKTTTLRMIAGLEVPTAGLVRFGDAIYSDSDSGTWVPTHKRPFAMVFQEYALWPHMSVYNNVAFPLKRLKVPRDQIRPRVQRALERVHMSQFGKRMPGELSGGQQQRVGIARAIVREPDLLLMDEPLSNLDAGLRRKMRMDLRHLQRELGLTTIYVTHDQTEASVLSDNLIVMNSGHIVDSGQPLGIHDRPANIDVARFMGEVNEIHGVVHACEGDTVDIAVGADVVLRARRASADPRLPPGASCRVVIRPQHFTLSDDLADAAQRPRANHLPATVTEAVFLGDTWEVLCRVGALSVSVRATDASHLSVDQPVALAVDPAKVLIFRL